MRVEEFIVDPVFQLNLLIWMAVEQPHDLFRVRPLFHEHRFELLYIEQPFAFPPEARRSIEQRVSGTELKIKLSPEPDLLLRRTNGEEALYIEAKKSAFTAQSSNSEQARGHLLAAGPVFGEVFRGLTRCLLVYVIPQDGYTTMKQCLSDLEQGLTNITLNPGDTAVDGLSTRDNAIYYHLDAPTNELIEEPNREVALIEQLSEDTDPSPLLLVYSDEDCPNEASRGFYRRALQNQVLARLVCDLQRVPTRTDFFVSARELLVRTTSHVFEYVGRGRQTAMERLIVQNVFRRIAEYWSERVPGLVRVQLRDATFHFLDEERKENFLDWIESVRKTNFPDTKPRAHEQPELFN